MGTRKLRWVSKLVVKKLVPRYFKVSSFASHLSAGPGYFVNDVSKHNVLVVSFCANFLPLWVLSQPNVVTQKWVAYAGIKGRHKGYDLLLCYPGCWWLGERAL